MSLVQPVKGNITQGFLGTFGAEPVGWYKIVNGVARGWRAFKAGAIRITHLHEAIDWACPDGTPIRAVHDGKIIAQGTDSYDGARYLYLQIKVGLIFKWVFVYWHLQPGSFRFKEGATVKAGTVIALSGHTGNVTGPHLHGELWKMLRSTPLNRMFRIAMRLDPRPFIAGRSL